MKTSHHPHFAVLAARLLPKSTAAATGTAPPGLAIASLACNGFASAAMPDFSRMQTLAGGGA